MNRKKQKILSSLNWKIDKKKPSTTKDNSKENEVLTNIEYVENLSLFKFKQLISSASSKDVEKGLYSINKLIRDEKEREPDEEDDDEDEENQLNYKNKKLSIIFEFLKSSPQLNEIFNIWELCIDKYQVYQNVYSLLLEFIAILITINDDPSLSHYSKILADKIITNKFQDLLKIINNYSDESVSLTLNCFRLLSTIVPLSLKIAKSIQTNIDFSSQGFQRAMNDISIYGAYLGTRPYVLRFLLSFLKHHNIKLSEFVLENDQLLVKYCQKLQLDNHNVILDLIESLEVNVLKVSNVSKILKIKFFSTSFLSKIGLIFSKEDIGEDSRQSIYKFLSILCCSSTHGIISSDPKWTWFRDNENPSFENKSLVSLITELNPIAYQTHQSLFIKIINSCPDLFTSYLKKLGTCEVSLSLNWLNRTTMLIKTLSSPVPKAPINKISNKLLDPIPSSPIVLINCLIPPQVSNLQFGFDQQHQLIIYNQLLVLLLCLKRVNQVLNSLNNYLIEKSNQQQQQQQQQQQNEEIEKLNQFIIDLKNGIKERLPQFRYFKENYNQFKQSTVLYSQFISIVSEYFRFLPINDLITLKMFDYQFLLTSDLYTQKQFIQLIGSSKSFHSTLNLFNRQDGGESIISMLLKLYLNSKSIEIKELYNQLIFKLLSSNSIYSGVDHEIDCWLESIQTNENIEFFEGTLINSHQNKFQYVDQCQIQSKKLFGSDLNQLLISPLIVSTIFQLLTNSQSCVDQHQYISNVLNNVANCKKNSLIILSIFNFIIKKKNQDKMYDDNNDQSILPSDYNLPKEYNQTLNYIYFKAYLNYPKDYSNNNNLNLKNQLISCPSPIEIKFIISNNIQQSILSIIIKEIEQKQEQKESFNKLLAILKVSPVHLVLSQINQLTTNEKEILFKNSLIKSILLNSISNLSLKKLFVLFPVIESQIEIHESQSSTIEKSLDITEEPLGILLDLEFDFYFDCLEKSIKMILDSKSILLLRLIDQLFSSNLIFNNFLLNHKFTFNISKLLLAILYNENSNNCFKFISPLLKKVLNQFNSKSILNFIGDKNGDQEDKLIISIKVLELILPFLEFNSCLELLNSFKYIPVSKLASNETILQIYLEIINSTLQFDNNNNDINLPSYFNLIIPMISDKNNKKINKLKIITDNNIYNKNNNFSSLKIIFTQLIQLSIECKIVYKYSTAIIYRVSIDQFILQLLLNDMNQIKYPLNLINSLLSNNNDDLLNKYSNYCLENYSPTTSTILSILLMINYNNGNAKEIKLNYKLLNLENLFKFDIMVWLSLFYWLIVMNKDKELLSNKKLIIQMFNSISSSNIFQRKNCSATMIYNETTFNAIIELYQIITNNLEKSSTQLLLLLNSKVNYFILMNSVESINIENIDIKNEQLSKSMVNNYLNNLTSNLKLNNKILLNLNLNFFNNFQKLFNYSSFDKIIKLVFSVGNFNSNDGLKIIEKLIFTCNSKSLFKYQYYIDLIFKEITNNDEIINLIKSTPTDIVNIENNSSNNDNLIRYRILCLLLSIYKSEPNLCHSAKNLSSIYFGIYNATTHPIDQVLLKIIYQHDSNNHSILAESNYLWGKHSKETSSVNQLLLSNTFFSGNQFENSINNYPFGINTLINNKNNNNSDNDDDDDVDSNEELNDDEELNDNSVIDEIKILKPYNEFSYDPSFLLRLFISLLDSYISEYSLLDEQQEDLRRENTHNLLKTICCFFYNGPFSFTVRSTSSNRLSIRQLAYSIFSKNQTLINIYYKQLEATQNSNIELFGIIDTPKKSSSKIKSKYSMSSNSFNENIMFKMIQVLKSTIFEKDQHIPSIFTQFYCSSIKVVSSKSDINRKPITSYLKGIANFDLLVIPMFSGVFNFSGFSKSTIVWLLELLTLSLPDSHTELLLKKNNYIQSLLALFDSFISTSKIKASILNCLLKLSTTINGVQLLIKQGILPWLSILISNSSCLKSYFDLIFKLFNNIVLTIINNNNQNNQNNNTSEFSQLSIILNNLLKLFLNINWDIEFKSMVSDCLLSLKSIINLNSSFIRLSNCDLVLLIKNYQSVVNQNDDDDDNKKLLLESIVSIISCSKLSLLPNDSNFDDIFIFDWICSLFDTNEFNSELNMIEPILKWIQDSLLTSKKQFIALLSKRLPDDAEIKLFNQLFILVSQFDIKLLNCNSTTEIQLLQCKKLVCNIMILLTSQPQIINIISKRYDQHHFYQLLSEIQSPNNQKIDDLKLYKNNVNNVIQYLKGLFI